MKRARVTALVVTIVAVWMAGCTNPPAKSSPNAQTSLGTLAEVERRVTADPSNPAISPKSGEVAYLLTFRGSIVIADFEAGWEKRSPLVDAQGREFVPVLAGTPGANGKLSQDNFSLTGTATGSGGGLVFKGSARVPEGVLVLAYLVPASAGGLMLKDGPAKHPLRMD